MLPVGFALILVVTALIGLNRFAFAVISMGGWACHSRDQSEQLKAVGEFEAVPFQARRWMLRIADLAGARRRLRDQDREHRDALALGKRTNSTPRENSRYWAVPIRRMLGERWFVPIARVGDVGNEEFPLVQTVTRISPRQDGTLFVFVNDAVLGVPKWWQLFYRWNKGTAAVTVKRVAEPPQT